MGKINKIFSYLIFSKKTILYPEKKKILFVDDLKKNDLVIKFLKKNNFDILHIRGEIINLRIILDCIFRLKFKFQDYINFYVNKVNPKIIITFLDNYPQVYAIDHKAKKILIQNAFRTGHENFDRIKKVVKGSGFIFCHNKFVGKMYRKYTKFNVVPSGSFKSNSIPTKKLKKKYDILFISTFRNYAKTDYFFEKLNLTIQNFEAYETLVLKYLKNFSKKHNLKLNILSVPTSKANANFFEQKKHYNKIIGANGWHLLNNNSENFAYHKIDQSTLIVGLDSTLLYESFVRKNKTFFFDVRFFDKKISKKFRRSFRFAYPSTFKREGIFWTSKLDSSSNDKKLLNLYFLNNKEWDKIYRKYVSFLMDYDKDNLKFKKIIKKYIN